MGPAHCHQPPIIPRFPSATTASTITTRETELQAPSAAKTKPIPSPRSEPRLLQQVTEIEVSPGQQIPTDSVSLSRPQQSTPPVSHSAPLHSSFPTGQTVDDLLNSILGVSTGIPPPVPVHIEPDLIPLPPPDMAPPVPPHPIVDSKSSHVDSPRIRAAKVRDVTFAHAVAPPSLPPIAQSIASASSHPPIVSTEAIMPHRPLFHAPHFRPTNFMRNNIRPPPRHQQVNGHPPQLPRHAMSASIAQTTMARAQKQDLPHLGGPNEKLRKKEFVQNMLELIHVSHCTTLTVHPSA